MSVSTVKTEPRLSTGLSLRANFSWTFAGNVAYAATQWGLLTVLTKFFSPEVFGQYALALGIVTPIFVASALQLRSVQVSDVSDKTHLADYWLLRLITNLLGLVVVVGMALVGVIPAHLFALSFVLGCNQVVVLTKDLYQGVLQKQERMDLVSVSHLLHGVSTLVVATVVAYLTRSVLWVVVGMLVARTLVMLLYTIPRARAVQGRTVAAGGGPLLTWSDLRRAWNGRSLFGLARTALPLGIVMLLISLYGNVPRYFLADWGEAEVGYFAAIASLVKLQEMVIDALGQSAVRRLTIYYTTKRQQYVRLLAQLFGIGVTLGTAGVAGALVLGRPLLSLLFRPEYASYTNVLIWLMVARVLANGQSFLGYGMTAARWFRLQVWTYGIMLVSLLIAAWLLIPAQGGMGAAWASLISSAISLAATIAFIVFKYRKSEEVLDE